MKPEPETPAPQEQADMVSAEAKCDVCGELMPPEDLAEGWESVCTSCFNALEYEGAG